MSDPLAPTLELPSLGLRSLADLLVGEWSDASSASPTLAPRRAPSLALPSRRATPPRPASP
ncbi:MAG TPA: hypothetical protein PK095_16735, partial [Myxococcota bacterium]|nr:hypothetical protein [Myxococcota bacterium]